MWYNIHIADFVSDQQGPAGREGVPEDREGSEDMIRRSGDKKVERHEHKFGADGAITVRNLINGDGELNGKGRTFAHTTVPPGSGIGFHVHNDDTEIYYVYSGRGEYNDNGVMTAIETGDVTFTPSGTGHGVRCVGDEPLELIALIIYE